MNFKTDILPHLPYDEPFLFVNDIIKIKEGFIKGEYTFPKSADFYRGHFKHKPITPGVLLTECAAQIALASYGVFKMKAKNLNVDIAMTSSQMEFLKPSFPDEKLIIEGKEVYFRFQKLKMSVKIFKADNTLVAQGELAGMIIPSKSKTNE